MCLRPTPVPAVPEETARIARAAFPRGHAYLQLRDTFGTFFTDDQFAALFAACGTPAVAPWRLALVTLLQFAENLSDRQTAAAVRSRIDWKYLLGLELTDPGFDASVLVEFRARLLAGAAEALLLDTLLEHCRAHGLLKVRGKQRTDATHVLARVRALNRLELVGETVRHALDALATTAPDWLQTACAAHVPNWATRYSRRFEELRLPQAEAEREALARSIGQDGYTLLTTVFAPDTPPAVRALPAVETLRHIWVQQYYRDPALPEGLRWRKPEELPPAPLRLVSPLEPDARWGKKRSTVWQGYKTHVTETCEPDHPLLITDVQTTAATAGDNEQVPEIQAKLQERNLLPGEQYVDAAYMEAAAVLASQEAYGIDLVGEVQEDTGWQARAQTGYAAADFTIDWERQQVTCPAGKQNAGWHVKTDKGRPVVQVHFAQGDCGGCPARHLCTRTAKAGRRLTLRPREEYEALQAARARTQAPAFRAQYAVRAGIEGTLSQGVRVAGLRRSRYVGWAKVHLQHLLTAAALNLVRLGEWLVGTPRAKTRQSAFARFVAAT